MSPAPRRRARRSAPITVYRTRGSRRRRLFLLAGVVLLATALAAAASLLPSMGGPSGSSATAAEPDKASADVTATGRSSSPSPATSPSASAVIEIGWVGDTTPGSKYGNPPDEGRALFAQVRDELRAPDLMIANLEGTYSKPGPSKCDGSDSPYCLAFQAPPSYAKALVWSGIDLVSVANNHAHDYLASGLEQTKAALKKNGIRYTGLPGQVTVVDVDGVDVAVLAFSPYAWNASIHDIPAAQALVRQADAKAAVVVVLMHAGAEGADKTHTPAGTEVAFGENRGNPRAFSHAVVDAGADLVLGSGPHVIRGIERYKDRLIAYSLGNFAGWDNFGLTGSLRLSGLLTVKLDGKGHFRGGRWLSLRLADPGVPVVDPAHSTAGMVRRLSQADFSRTYPTDAEGNLTVP